MAKKYDLGQSIEIIAKARVELSTAGEKLITDAMTGKIDREVYLKKYTALVTKEIYSVSKEWEIDALERKLESLKARNNRRYNEEEVFPKEEPGISKEKLDEMRALWR